MSYSKINVSFLGVSAFFNQTFSSLFVCTRFGGNPLFISVLIDARLSWDRVTGPDPGRTKHTQRSEGKSHSSIQSGEMSPCSQLCLHPNSQNLPLRRDWSTQGGARINLQTPPSQNSFKTTAVPEAPLLNHSILWDLECCFITCPK